MSIEFLRRLPLFAELKRSDLDELYASAETVTFDAGQMVMEEGTPPEAFYVILRGEVEVLKKSGQQDVVIAVRGAGEGLGELSLLAQTPRTASVRARNACQLLKVSADAFRRLIECSPAASMALVRTTMERLRNTEAMLRQSEKMASLGTMAAGLAHELNNPAAAAKSSIEQLHKTLDEFSRVSAALGALNLSDAQFKLVAALHDEMIARAQSPTNLDPLTRSDRESEAQAWLEAHGVENAWEIAPVLVMYGWQIRELKELGETVGGQLSAVVRWLASGVSTYALLNEVAMSVTRVAEIVKAVKSYSFLDQAPVQEIDVHEGLENTLVILRHKLKNGIVVRRNFASNLPPIEAYGSELNQVWTNLIDNAADAMQARGELELATRVEEGKVVVEVCDNGPGIAAEIQSRVFEPFFTTKAVGKGTGLGLNISYNIVQKHRGKIEVESVPGRTCFRVRLPTRLK